MKTSAAGVGRIKMREGLRLEAYPDPGTKGAPWTIGYGHTGRDVYKGLRINEPQACSYLATDVADAEGVINRVVTVDLTQDQFDALVSFVLNVGAGAKGVKDGFVMLKNGQPSTMLRKINANDLIGAASEFPKWNRAAGRVLPGLVARRASEQSQFLTGKP
ncbi:lysozyme [Cupriavidus sp. 30B13]|uniref:lysozyme n=1 Tax=Cupriavidus sp. 30B13 TaxID=3384241 RepID=UPI003B8F6EBF